MFWIGFVVGLGAAVVLTAICVFIINWRDTGKPW